MKQQKKAFERDFLPDIQKLLNRRIYILNPWQLDSVAHLYRYVMSPKEWGAWNFLCKHPGFDKAAQYTSRAKLCDWPEDLGMRSFEIHIKEAKHNRKRFPDIRIPWSNLPSGVQNYLTQWISNDAVLRAENNRTYSQVKECGELVNTWGQLYRLWPGLVSLFPTAAGQYGVVNLRDLAMCAKAKSTLNGECYVWNSATNDLDLKPCFAPKAVEVSGMILAEAMLLPDWKGNEYTDWPEVFHK